MAIDADRFKRMARQNMTMRRKLLGSVLCLVLCGCCHQIPVSDLAAFEPMARLSDLNGTFAGISTAGDDASLWNSLTERLAKWTSQRFGSP